MVKLVDIHNHLNLLPGFLNGLSGLAFGNKFDPYFMLAEARRRNWQTIVSVPFYISPLLGDPLVQITKQKTRLEKFVTENKDVRFIYRKSDLYGDYKLGFVLQLESARWIKGDIALLNTVFNLGVRGIIPIHFLSNWIGDSSDDPRSLHNGLSDEGKLFLSHMQKLNLWMDTCHMNEITTAEALNYYDGAVMASHTAIKEFKSAKRNLSLENAKIIADKHGIIGFIAWTILIGKSASKLKDQIQYLLDHGHQKTLAIGTDLGAPISTPDFIKSTFDYADFFNTNFPNYANQICAQNALSFLERNLPD